jgi:predicted dehydrogenase
MKLGLIGAQSSHARHFCDVINGKNSHPGYRIEFLYGGDGPEEAAALSAGFNVAVCADEDEVIEKSDAVIITYRRGSLHHAAAMKVLRAEKPLFNDKPFATRARDAKEITDCAQARGVLITGGSSLKCLPGVQRAAAEIGPGSSVVIAYAADPSSEYEGYWFYGPHAAETCVALCGEQFTDVRAFRNGSAVVSVVEYSDRRCVIVTAPDADGLKIAVTNSGKTTVHNVEMDYQSVCPNEFVEMLKSRKAPRAYSHYVESTELLHRIIASAQL